MKPLNRAVGAAEVMDELVAKGGLSRKQLEEEQALLRMWERRVIAHPMLEVSLRMHQLVLGRLDKELRAPADGRPTFEEDAEKLFEARVAAISAGKVG